MELAALQLVRQQLADVVDDERADPHEELLLVLVHDAAEHNTQRQAERRDESALRLRTNTISPTGDRALTDLATCLFSSRFT